MRCCDNAYIHKCHNNKSMYKRLVKTSIACFHQPTVNCTVSLCSTGSYTPFSCLVHDDFEKLYKAVSDARIGHRGKPLRCISKLSVAATLSLLQCNNIGAILQDIDENGTMRHSNTSEEHLQFTIKHLTRGRVMIILEWSSTTKMILKERC